VADAGFTDKQQQYSSVSIVADAGFTDKQQQYSSVSIVADAGFTDKPNKPQFRALHVLTRKTEYSPASLGK
jgi:hypothetical protein